MKFIRLLILAVALIAACYPQHGRAADRVIAAVMSSDQPRYREAHRAFVKSMAAHGYTSANTEIILQIPNPDQLSWSNTIRKFNAYKPNLLIAYGAPVAQVAMKEAKDIPVLAVDMYAQEQPPRGTFGISSRVPMITLLKTFKEIRSTRRIGVIYNSHEIGSHRQMEEVLKYASQLGIQVIEGNATSASSVLRITADLLEKTDALIVTESGVVCRQFEKIVARAKARSVPVLSPMPDAAEKGAMISLEINPQEQGKLATEVALQLLNGTRQEQLSLVSPRRIDLIVNLKVARELGLNIPFPVLAGATRILK